MIRRILYIALLALCAPAVVSGATSAKGDAMLKEVQARQKKIVSVSATFNQTKRTELLDRPIKSSGTFQFKPGVGVRWEYTDSMTVVYDGKVLFVYYIDLNEAEKIHGTGNFAGPLVFDIESLKRDFDITAARSDEGEITLTLKPKPKKKLPFVLMTMVFGNNAPFPYRVNITEESGDRTEIKFSNIKLGKSIDNSVFVFTPPIGVVVRERTFEQ